MTVSPENQSPQMEPFTMVIPDELSGKRLDQALAILLPQHSRARLQSWIRSGRVTVDARAAGQRDAVRGGQTVVIEAGPAPAGGRDLPQPIALDLVHQDDSILVLNKPPGLVVHPGAGNPDNTLLNALLHHAPRLQGVPRAGIVHRLDKDTSGLMVIAATPESHTFLVQSLKRREIRREYRALVCGVMTAGGTVNAAIGRHRQDRRRMAVMEGGREAVTHYRVIRRFAAHTLIRVMLETGRTHQIRVHMAHIRHPLVGDPVYGGRRRVPGGVSEALRAAVRDFPRQALHAGDLALVHPRSGEAMQWSAPVPDDMQALLDLLEHEP